MDGLLIANPLGRKWSLSRIVPHTVRMLAQGHEPDPRWDPANMGRAADRRSPQGGHGPPFAPSSTTDTMRPTRCCRSTSHLLAVTAPAAGGKAGLRRHQPTEGVGPGPRRGERSARLAEILLGEGDDSRPDGVLRVVRVFRSAWCSRRGDLQRFRSRSALSRWRAANLLVLTPALTPTQIWMPRWEAMRADSRSTKAIPCHGPSGTRTQDLGIKSPLLYQLS